MSERDGPISDKGFARMLRRAAVAAGLGELKVHPHMLRHACGFALANDQTPLLEIQQHLGHARMETTVLYARLAPGVSARKRWRRTV
jgi:site-specific recombinase XerD